jgi:hypothetical protein
MYNRINVLPSIGRGPRLLIIPQPQHQPLVFQSLYSKMKRFSTVACLAPIASAARFMLHVPTTQLVNPSTLSSTTHATLQSTGPPQDSYITRSNTFNFNNVSIGSYLATVHCHDFAFEPLRIDVTVEETVEGSGEKKEMIRAWQTFIGNEWDNKGEGRGEGGNGLVVEVKPMGQKNYYQDRGGCEYPKSRTTLWGSMINKSSLSTLVSEESNDFDGPFLYGPHLWHALLGG